MAHEEILKKTDLKRKIANIVMCILISVYNLILWSSVYYSFEGFSTILFLGFTSILGTALLSYIREQLLEYLSYSVEYENVLMFDRYLDELDELLYERDIDEDIKYEILSQVSKIWCIYNSIPKYNTDTFVYALRKRDCKIVMSIIHKIVSMAGMDVGTVVSIYNDILEDIEFLRLHGNVDQTEVLRHDIDRMLNVHRYRDPDSILIGLCNLYEDLNDTEEIYIQSKLL